MVEEFIGAVVYFLITNDVEVIARFYLSNCRAIASGEHYKKITMC